MKNNTPYLEQGIRIKNRRCELNLTQEDVADALDVTYQAVQRWESGYSLPRAHRLEELAKVLQTKVEFITAVRSVINAEPAHIKMKGHKATITHHSISDIEEKLGVKRDPKLFEQDKPASPTFIDIPYYQEAELSMGNGTVIHDDEHPGRTLSFQQHWLDSLNLDPQHLVVVKCVGRSMEPRIFDQDVVLINKNIESIEDGAIYALNFAGQAKLKRLITRSDGSLIIRSDNKDEFPDEIIEEHESSQLKIVGKAVWIGSTLI